MKMIHQFYLFIYLHSNCTANSLKGCALKNNCYRSTLDVNYVIKLM